MKRPLIAGAVLGIALVAGATIDAAAQSTLRPVTSIAGGVTTIRYPAGTMQAAPRYRLDATPIAIIGGANADERSDLTSIGDPVILRDGRIVAGDKKLMHLTVWAPDGKVQRVIGRTGSGPGEFQQLAANHLGVVGDTIVVFDNAVKRVSWTRPDTGVVRERPFVTRFAPGMVTPDGVVNGKLLMTFTTWLLPPNDSTHRPHAPTLLQSFAPLKTDTVGYSAGPLMTNIEINVRGQTRRQTVPVRWDGEEIVHAVNNRIVVAAAGPYLLEYRNAKGVAERRVSIDVPRRPVTAAMRDAEINWRVSRSYGAGSEGAGGGDMAAHRKDLAAESKFADSLPAIATFTPLPDGSLWAVDGYTRADTRWGATLFGPDGMIKGRLEGTGAAPVTFAADRLVQRSEDADGVVTWRVLRIVPPK